MSRRILIGASALIVLIALAGGLYLYRSLDGMVARAIEREGERALGVSVEVASVDLDLSRGVGTIRGIRVGNPDGFQSDGAFELQQVVLELVPASLRTPPLRLARVEVAETEVRLEVDERGRSNLDEIVRHTRQTPDRDPDAEAGEATRLAIDRLHFAGGTVHVDYPGAEDASEVSLPAFDRERIGGATGATGGEVAKVVAQALARQIAATAAASQAQRAVEQELGGAAGEAAGSIVRGLLGD